MIFYLTVSFFRHIPRLVIPPVSYMESFLCNYEGINKIIRSRYVTISKDMGYSLTAPFTSYLYSVTHGATLGLHFKHAAGIKLLKYCRYGVKHYPINQSDWVILDTLYVCHHRGRHAKVFCINRSNVYQCWYQKLLHFLRIL